MFFSRGLPLKCLSIENLIWAGLGVSRTIYVNAYSPNLVFPYFNFLWEAQCKKTPCTMNIYLQAIKILFWDYITCKTLSHSCTTGPSRLECPSNNCKKMILVNPDIGHPAINQHETCSTGQRAFPPPRTGAPSPRSPPAGPRKSPHPSLLQNITHKTLLSKSHSYPPSGEMGFVFILWKITI